MTRHPRIASLALALLLAVPALASAADAARVAEFMEVTKVEENMAQMQVFMGKAMDDGFTQEAQRRGLQGASLDKARAAHEVVKKDLLTTLNWQEVGPEVSALYQKELTNAEVDAAVAYYRSPEGASMLAKQPALMQATMQIGQRRAQALVPKMQAEMQSVFGDEAPATAPPAQPQG